MKRALATVAGVLLLGGCGVADMQAMDRGVQPLPERAGEGRSEPLGDDRVRTWPASGAAEEGVRYRMVTYTHCGLDHQLDLDGSFWEVVAAPDDAWDVLADPVDEGVITLQGPDVAVYASSGGGRFRLRRLDGPRDTLPCD